MNDQILSERLSVKVHMFSENPMRRVQVFLREPCMRVHLMRVWCRKVFILKKLSRKVHFISDSLTRRFRLWYDGLDSLTGPGMMV